MKTQNRKQFTFSMPAELVITLDAWRERQPAVPSRSAVLKAALRLFLAQQGVELPPDLK